MKTRRLIIILVAWFFFFGPPNHRPTVAQSTLDKIPSTDVVSERNTYLEFDYISHYASHYNGGFQSYEPRVAVGLGHNVEVGVNVIYTDGFGVNQPIEIQPNIKWRFYQNEKERVSAVAGVMLYVRHRTPQSDPASFATGSFIGNPSCASSGFFSTPINGRLR